MLYRVNIVTFFGSWQIADFGSRKKYTEFYVCDKHPEFQGHTKCDRQTKGMQLYIYRCLIFSPTRPQCLLEPGQVPISAKHIAFLVTQLYAYVVDYLKQVFDCIRTVKSGGTVFIHSCGCDFSRSVTLIYISLSFCFRIKS